MAETDVLDELLLDPDGENNVPVELVTTNKYLILSFFTMGLYDVWWTFKRWSFFKEKDNLDIMPVARTIFNIFFLYSLFERLYNFATKNGYKDSNYSSGGLFAFYIVCQFLTRLPDPYWLISLVGIFAFIQPLQAFNHAIENSTFYKAVYHPSFNGRQWFLIIVGVIFWGLVLMGLLMESTDF